ncbi:hypothetical protein PsorP6_008624 [Peronosclerospora sorghi]|uniref:Uncharacterized protein n=1 Tax=Peronosclerospora sorghi TaxID=230839 RepID=A0ACC0W8T8_9STRA|nr:hypothetical protein PsorP6_008624 [Peronosclerospora sorghi]
MSSEVGLAASNLNLFRCLICCCSLMMNCWMNCLHRNLKKLLHESTKATQWYTADQLSFSAIWKATEIRCMLASLCNM